MKGHALFKGEIHKKKTLTTFKIFLSRNTGPISNKLSPNHNLVKGIQIYANEGPCPLKGEIIVMIH